jgi:aminoglycoside 6'-N-acetyltransferase
MQTNLLGDTNIFGDRVELRSVKQNDFELLFRWMNDPEVYRWWGGMPIDSDVIRQKYLGLRRPQNDGFIIEVAGIPIGYAQRHQTGESEGSIDLFLVPEMRGRGYGGDAVRALVEYLTQVGGWKRITVDPEEENILAQRFWRKFGFAETEEITAEGNPVLIFGGSSRQSSDGESL